jgi:hypothetical protein
VQTDVEHIVSTEFKLPKIARSIYVEVEEIMDALNGMDSKNIDNRLLRIFYFMRQICACNIDSIHLTTIAKILIDLLNKEQKWNQRTATLCLILILYTEMPFRHIAKEQNLTMCWRMISYLNEHRCTIKNTTPITPALQLLLSLYKCHRINSDNEAYSISSIILSNVLDFSKRLRMHNVIGGTEWDTALSLVNCVFLSEKELNTKLIQKLAAHWRYTILNVNDMHKINWESTKQEVNNSFKKSAETFRCLEKLLTYDCVITLNKNYTDILMILCMCIKNSFLVHIMLSLTRYCIERIPGRLDEFIQKLDLWKLLRTQIPKEVGMTFVHIFGIQLVTTLIQHRPLYIEQPDNYHWFYDGLSYVINMIDNCNLYSSVHEETLAMYAHSFVCILNVLSQSQILELLANKVFLHGFCRMLICSKANLKKAKGSYALTQRNIYSTIKVHAFIGMTLIIKKCWPWHSIYLVNLHLIGYFKAMVSAFNVYGVTFRLSSNENNINCVMELSKELMLFIENIYNMKALSSMSTYERVYILDIPFN